MRQLLYTALAYICLHTLFYSCKPGHGKPTLEPRPRDTSINTSNAYIARFADSAQIISALTGKGLSTNDSLAIANFYAGRNYQYAWFDSAGIAEQALNFVNLYRSYAISTGDSSILNPAIDTLMDKLPDDSAFFANNIQLVLPTEANFTIQFFRYAAKAYQGNYALDLRNLEWFIPQKKLNTVAFLDTLLARNGRDVNTYLPVNHQFEQLRKMLVRYSQIEKSGAWKKIPFSRKKYVAGDSAAELINLKKRMQLVGDLPAGNETPLFDTALTVAIKRWQERYGLKPDGIIGTSVIDELNRPLEYRIRQILINLERARWIPQVDSSRFIFVNIPDFRVHIFDSGRLQFSLNVVVGKPATNTVIFTANMKYIVLAPYWNVPYSIVKNEMGRSASYFARRNMEVVGRYADGLPMVRQKPGANNSLGRIKFLFPNQYSIYLHDTPAKNLFGEQRRAFSHGCIRVQEPFRLAHYLLADNPEWPNDKVLKVARGATETTITLKREVPVFVGYFTAWVDGQGRLNFRNDIYGHDCKMAERLYGK
jgi:murein L,D-transpeptidase YcbB/YkuD